MKKPCNAIAAIFILMVVFSLEAIFFSQSLAAPAQTPASATSAQKLHRADFRVTGASCVACLRRIGKTLREQKGVMKADVSIFKPYWAIVIFDSAQTSMPKLLETLVKEKVKFEDIEERAINSVPLIVIPKGLNTADSHPLGAGEHASDAATHAAGNTGSHPASTAPAAH